MLYLLYCKCLVLFSCFLAVISFMHVNLLIFLVYGWLFYFFSSVLLLSFVSGTSNTIKVTGTQHSCHALMF